MPADIPLFSENMRFTPTSIVPASGDRAVAEAYGSAAHFMRETSQFATDIYAEQQVERVKRGDIGRDDLPPPVTVVGKKMRAAYAEGQAIETNIQITKKIREITNDDSLSPDGMALALQENAEAMIASSIPEMGDVIRTNFATAGVSAINAAANKRLAEQRALQDESQKAQLGFWEDEYKRSRVADLRADDQVEELREIFGVGKDSDYPADGPALEGEVLPPQKGGEVVLHRVGPGGEKQYIEAYNAIDHAAPQRAATAQANLLKTINSRVASGRMTEEMAAVYMNNLARDVRNDYLSFEASEKGLSVLDKADLSFDEKLAIAQKASNLAGMKNAEEDRAERKRDEAVAQQNASELQTAKNKAMDGDIDGARAITEALAKRNQAIGSTSLMGQIDAVNADINLVAAAGGPPHPEVERFYERGLQTGDFKTMDDVLSHVKDNGKTLNADEILNLRQTSERLVDSGLSSPTYQATRQLINLRLADDPDEPTPLEKAMGAKKTPRQKVIERERNRIEDALISGVMDRTMVTPQQQRDFVESEIKAAKREIFADEMKDLTAAGVKVDDPPVKVKERVAAIYGAENTELAKQKFKQIVKSQIKMRELIGE